jgi:hypothetical protein
MHNLSLNIEAGIIAYKDQIIIALLKDFYFLTQLASQLPSFTLLLMNTSLQAGHPL